MGPARARALLETLEDVDALLVDSQGALWITDGLRGAFTPMGTYAWAKINWIR